MKEYVLNSDFQLAKDIINQILHLDIMVNKRKRNLVDACMIYASILRQYKHTLDSIGKSINKDHSTILYYMKHFDTIYRTDIDFKMKYDSCYETFFNIKLDTVVLPKSNDELKNEVKLLRYRLKSLEEKQTQVIAVSKKYSRLRDIIKVIDERCPRGFEQQTKVKINTMFNSFTFK